MTAPRLTVVGHCTSTSAQILCCVDCVPGAPGRVARLAWHAAGRVGFLDLPLVPASPYEVSVFHLKHLPGSAEVTYAVAVHQDRSSLPDADALLGSGGRRAFRLLPTHRPVRVALLSCNHTSDIKDPKRRFGMWGRLRGRIEAGHVDLIVHAGDQVYADTLVSRYERKIDRHGRGSDDLLEVLTEEYRRLYIEEAWNAREVADVLASCPSVMMWDDHDIDDGWGSNDKDHEPWRRLFFRAAQQAFIDFQASLNPPRIDAGSYACGFTHGDVAFLLLDGRSHRMYKDGRVLGSGQLESARRWLAALPPTCRRVYLVLGTPPVHVTWSAVFTIGKWLPSKKLAADLRDSWVAPGNRQECSALMEMLREFLGARTATDVTILSGDVHVGSIGRLEPEDGAVGADTSPVMWQITSSGIGSAPPGGFMRWALKRVTSPTVSLGGGVHGRLLPVMREKSRLLFRRNFAVLMLDNGAKERGTSRLEVSFVAEGLDEPLVFVLPGRSHPS